MPYAAPTGTGKSLIELDVQQRVGATIVTPRLEIVSGMLDKLGVKHSPDHDDNVAAAGMAHGIYTPIRLRDRMLRGEMRAPERLILDKGHHDLASTWQDIHALCGGCPVIMYTATPYRGTPRGTAAFREMWGPPHWILTYPQAMARGALSFPQCRMLPLVDDDVIEVRDGELVASQVESAVRARLGDVVERSRAWYDGQYWTMPTMYSCPSTSIAAELAERLTLAGMLAYSVAGATSWGERQTIFRGCVKQLCALVQVYVVSEGVDLPIRRLVDLAPSLSPVKWLQQFGRITRPSSDAQPEYWCTNRNLLRHAYLLDGCLPQAALKEAQTTFPPGKRTAARVVGLEVLGRLRATELPLSSGLTALCYALSAVEGNSVTQYFVIVHPGKAEPVWASRRNEREAGQTVGYGKWQRCTAPASLEGFASLPAGTMTEKMAAWWKRSASRFGLDAATEPNRRVFQALPVLSDLRCRL
jgi:hypothetical protein